MIKAIRPGGVDPQHLPSMPMRKNTRMAGNGVAVGGSMNPNGDTGSLLAHEVKSQNRIEQARDNLSKSDYAEALRRAASASY